MRRRLQPMAFVLAFSFGEPVGFFLGRFHRIGDRVRLRLTGSLFFFRFLVFFFRSTLWMTSSWRSLTKPWKSRVPRKRTPSFFLRLEVLRTKKKLKKPTEIASTENQHPPTKCPTSISLKKIAISFDSFDQQNRRFVQVESRGHVR